MHTDQQITILREANRRFGDVVAMQDKGIHLVLAIKRREPAISGLPYMTIIAGVDEYAESGATFFSGHYDLKSDIVAINSMLSRG